MSGIEEKPSRTETSRPGADDDQATVLAATPIVRDAIGADAFSDGMQIGGYRIIREIGSGGMGSILLAERVDREFRHQVAIKVVRGFPTKELLERFRRERELLATLRHPNIARLFDGGTTPGGQPYLVMEYIEGIPLDQWCVERKLPLRKRLRLFQSLCSAVQHAHQQLIIHRDLKPANVLVRDNDEPVLLDFGIGKLIDQQADTPEETHFRALTPAYASPEQLVGRAASTLSDIYGLGLILFELLSGTPLRKKGGDTTRLMASQVASVADDWLRTDARMLRGDLDNITRKALREEPERRYPTAAEMSADIQAWFDGKPVSAAPDAWSYRLKKFVMRHPLALGATAAVIVLLTLLSVRLADERDRALAAQAVARMEAEGANQSASFLIDLFEAASPETTQGRALTVRDLIDDARRNLDNRQFSRPEVKARLEAALGGIYHTLGLPQPSVELLEQAVERMRAAGDDSDQRVLGRALTGLTRTYTLLGRNEVAVETGREALALNRRVQPIGDPQIGHSLQTLGVAEEEMNNYDVAMAHFEEAERIFAAAGPDYRGEVGNALHNQGWAARRRGDLMVAETLLMRALTIKEEFRGPLHPSTFYTLSVLSQLEAEQGKYDAAVVRLRDLVEREKKVLGEPNKQSATTYSELGSALQDAGRFAESAESYRMSITQHEAIGESSGPDLAVSINNYASLLESMEDFPTAEEKYRAALAMRIERGALPQAIARGHHNLARLMLASGRPNEAREHAKQAWLIRNELKPEAHPERLDAMLFNARIALRVGDVSAADDWLLQYQRTLIESDLNDLQRARRHEANVEFAAARADRGVQVAEQRALVDILAKRFAGDHPLLARQRIELAAMLFNGDRNQRAEARSLLEQARVPALASLHADGPTRRKLAMLTTNLRG